MALLDINWDEPFAAEGQINMLVNKFPSASTTWQHTMEFEESQLCLRVARFSNPPKIDFDAVKVGKHKLLDFYVTNPNSYSVDIHLLPLAEDCSFEIFLHQNKLVNDIIHLEPHSHIQLQVKWSPVVAGNVRQVVNFKWEGGQRLQATFLGCAVGDGKRKKSRNNVHKNKTAQNSTMISPVKRKALVAIQLDSPSRRTTFSVNKPGSFDDVGNKENQIKAPSCSPLSFEKQHKVEVLVDKSKFKSNIPKPPLKNLKVIQPNVNDIDERRKTYHVPKKEVTKRTLFNEDQDKPKQRSYLKRKSSSHELPKRALQAGIAMKKLSLKTPKTSLPRHPMPFAAKNMFYDERWIDKQERGFTNWLNYILTPQDEEDDADNDRRETYTVSASKHQPIAPTREDLSLRTYSLRFKMARLRRTACMCYQSEEFMFAIHKIEKEVECGMLAVRSEKHIQADLGVKGRILKMILSYNTLWLRIGLEVIYGEIIPLHSNHDLAHLSKFVMQRLLANPDIEKQFSHPTVPNLFKAGYEDVLSKYILKKFLLLVVFLDYAKGKRIIDHDPCLFNKDSEFKTSRDILLRFSCDYLKGEGDLTKHLSYLGLTVNQSQTALDEYDFGVKNIAVDLRDGVRIVRVVELLTKQWTLSKKVRLPAVSRLQKVHNVGLALNFLATQGLEIMQDSKCIVDGHREKTLLILWQIIFNFQVGLLLDLNRIKDEIVYLKKTLQFRNEMMLSVTAGKDFLGLNRRESIENEIYFKSEKLSLLLKWCKIICAHYDVKIENFTVSFSDGIAFCCLVNFYHPNLLPKSLINHETTLTCNIAHQEEGVEDDFFYDNWTKCFSPNTGINRRLETLLHNEKENFRMLNEAVQDLGGVPSMIKSNDFSNTIPDEKVVITYVSYLCSRLLNIRTETQAARQIQLAWRKYMFVKRKKSMQVYDVAAIKIQACFRGFQDRMDYLFIRECIIICQSVARRWLVRHHMKERQHAAQLIQSAYRSFMDTSEIRYIFLQLKSSTIVIQRYYRAYLQQKLERKNAAATIVQSSWRRYQTQQKFWVLKSAVIVIQAWARMEYQRNKYLDQKWAAITIQEYFLAYLTKKKCRVEYLASRTSVCKIQQFWRNVRVGYLQRERYSTILKATRRIQAWYRMEVCRNKFTQLRSSVAVIQTRWRSILACRRVLARYRIIKAAAVIIQRCFRAWRTGMKEVKIVTAAIIVQTWWRNKRETDRLQKEKRACSCIQSSWRMYVTRNEYLSKRSAALKIQSWCKSIKEMEKQKYEYLYTRKLIVFMQSCVRRNVSRRLYAKIVCSALVIQNIWRNVLLTRREKDKYWDTKRKIITIQSYIRMYQTRGMFVSKRAAVVKMQSFARMLHSKKKYVEYKNAAIKLQSFFRMKYCQDRYKKIRPCAVIIQSCVRKMLARLRFLAKKAAAVKIQSSYRTHTQQKRLFLMRQAAVRVQCTYRMYIARRSYIERHNAVTYIQATRKMVVVRNQYLREKQAVIAIQSFYRMAQKWREFQSLKAAASKVQTIYRMCRERKKFLLMKNSIIRVQSVYRMHAARKSFLEVRCACIKIQAIWKGFFLRKIYLVRVHAVTKIQSVFRMNKTRKYYSQQKEAVILIQSIYRMNRDRREVAMRKKVIVYIQSVCKMHMVRNRFTAQKQAVIKLQSMVRMYLVRRRFNKQESAAMKIQSWLKMNRCRILLKKKRTAIVTFQSLCRMYQARCRYMQEKRACIVIQAYVRMYLARSHFCVMKKSIMKIQSTWRMYAARQRYIRTLQAIRRLQSIFKMHAVRKNFTMKRRSCVRIQNIYRRYVDRKKMKNKMALKIQSVWRRFAARSCYLSMKGAVTKLQATVRMYHLKSDFKRKHNAAVQIQVCYRSYKNESRRKNMATIKIQAFVRMILQRRCFQERKDSIILLQSLCRMYVTRRDFLVLKRATLKIQSTIRMYLARVNAVNVLNAVTKIQSVYRMHRSKINFRVYKQKVVKIQSVIRMFLHRRSYQRKEYAITLVQATWRMYMCRLVFQQKCNAAIRIQSMYRMCSAYKSFCMKKEATIVVQAFVRMRKMKMRFLSMRQAAVCIQVWWRMQLGYKKMKSENKAAIIIQSAFRMHQCRKFFLRLRNAATKIQTTYKMHVHKSLKKKNNRAAVRIQAWYRMNLERKLFLNTKKAAVTIQRRYRAFSLGYGYYLKYHVMRGAIITIQALARGHLLRKDVERKLRFVVVIQSCYRMYVQRRRFLELKKKVIVCQQHARKVAAEKRLERFERLVVRMQSYVRQSLARKQLKKRRMEQRSAILIQSIVRMKFATKQFHDLVEEARRENAATCFQAMWRMHMQRIRYKRISGAVRVLQCTVKAYLQRKRYACLLNSAVLIQRWYRSNIIVCLERKLFLKMQVCAVQIQSIWRSYLARKTFVRMLTSTFIIQRWWRKQMELLIEREMEAACKVIQQWYRQYAIRRKYRSTNAATIIISFFKMLHCRNLYKQLRSATIIIQKWYLCERMRQSHQAAFTEKKMATVKIQKCYRNSKFRKNTQLLVRRFILRYNAATKIQRSYREYCITKKAREEYLKRIAALLLIQKRVHIFLMGKKHEREEHAACTIQRWYKVYGSRKQMMELNKKRMEAINSFVTATKLCLSVLKIQRWRRRNLLQQHEKLVMRREVAAAKIQSTWRGFVVRRKIRDKRVEEARRRIDVANKNVTEPMKLCNRTKSALDYLLHVKNLSTVHDALQQLDVVTVLSVKCCEQVVRDNVLPVIFKIIRHGNRSLPWVSIKQVAFSILLNVAKCPHTYHAVYTEDASVSTILEQMSNFCDKKAFIFPMGCNLLNVLCNDEQVKLDIIANKTALEKIRNFYRLSKRKQKLNLQRDLTKEKEQHYTKTAWQRRASFVDSKDGYTAIHMLANKLNLL